MASGQPAAATGARFSTVDRAQRVRFRRAITLMVMTLVIPGSAQLVAGSRRIGRIAMRTWLALLLTGLATGLVAWFSDAFVFWAASNTLVLGALRLLLMCLAVGWALLFVDAWRIGQPLTLHRKHRLGMVGVNGLLCFSVAGTLLFGAHLVGVQRQFMITMFGEGAAAGAADGRFNILLLGGDAGAGRWGLRPDSLTVASVDATTGKTVLIGLPRNMANFPFAEGSVMAGQFPNGFDCEGCYLNGVATWALDHKELFKGSKQPGVDATVQAVEGITDLDISYWAMINLEGFKDLVDAFGGVTLNVRSRIPVGLPHDDFYTHIEPGVKKLNGFETLWFARARYDSDDYSRMARQKCVMNAMLQQVSPDVALRNFSKIAKASSDMVSTNVPRGEVDRFVQLAMRAKEQRIASVSLVPPKVNTGNPDMDVVHQMISDAIDRAEGDAGTAASAPAPATPAATPAAETSATTEGSTGGSKKATQAPAPTQAPSVTGGSLGSLKEGYQANDADDLGAAC